MPDQRKKLIPLHPECFLHIAQSICVFASELNGATQNVPQSAVQLEALRSLRLVMWSKARAQRSLKPQKIDAGRVK